MREREGLGPPSLHNCVNGSAAAELEATWSAVDVGGVDHGLRALEPTSDGALEGDEHTSCDTHDDACDEDVLEHGCGTARANS